LKGYPMRYLSLFLSLFVLVAPAAAADKPNILLIIADDMGLDASKCYQVGNQKASMPNLEKLCADGLVFENAYSAPLCSPTRATIMSGLYGFRTGVGTAITRDGGNGLAVDTTSLFDVLEPTDYATAVIGKWHLASKPSDLNNPADLGVKDYFGIISGAVRDYKKWTSVENGVEKSETGYTTTVLTDRAVDWIGKQQQPWFLWLAYNAPHAPFHLPPKELLTSSGELADDQAAMKSTPLPYYNAALEALDSEIGRLLKSMSPEVRANTVIMFIGDNGSPGQVAEAMYGERGAKGSIFEGGSHVPFIVQGPDIKAGRTKALMNSVDLHATIAGLAGAKTSTPDSIDFQPVLGGGESVRSFAYVEHFSPTKDSLGNNTYGWAIRDARYKLGMVDGEQPKLFDLQADPNEATDLMASSPTPESEAAVKALQATFDGMKAKP
jgi:arylsulfatase A-like enzyme